MSAKTIKKIEEWKKSLLDIGKRNQLINFKDRKTSTLNIIHPNLETMFNYLDQKKMIFAELFDRTSDDYEENDDFYGNETITAYGITLPKKDTYRTGELLGVIHEWSKKNNKLDKKRFIFSNASTKRQNQVLRSLVKRSRIFKEENAINILYLSLGMLNWYENRDSKELLKSPLLLIPVELSQDTYHSPFNLQVIDDNFIINESLLKRMNIDFKLDLNFNLNEYESDSLAYQKYKEFILSKVNNPRWFIDDTITIGLFSFSKITMVNDLEKNTDKILKNNIIKAFSNESTSYEFLDLQKIKLDTNLQKTYQVLNADSSQELAISAAIAGKSFVLQGPPGTGKSQTITNIIAELIGHGKKVLFVSEKKAALDVVYNNLKKAKLHHYAMPLHDTKVDKKEIITELYTSLNERQKQVRFDQDKLTALYQKYLRDKNALNAYSRSISIKKSPINQTIFELFNEYFKYSLYPDIQFAIKDISTIDELKKSKLLLLIKEFEQSLKDLNYTPNKYMWKALLNKKLDFDTEEIISSTAKSLFNSIVSLHNEVERSKLIVKLNDNYSISNIVQIISLYTHLANFNYLDDEIINHPNIKEDIKNYDLIFTALKDNASLEKEISKKYNDSIFSDSKLPKIHKSFINNANPIKRFFSIPYRINKKRLLKHQTITNQKYKTLLNDIKQIFAVTLNRQIIENNFKNLIYTKKCDLKKITTIKKNLDNLRWYQTFIELKNLKLFTISEKEYLNLTNKALKEKEVFLDIAKHINSKFSTVMKELTVLLSHLDDSKLNMKNIPLVELLHILELSASSASLRNYLSYLSSYQKAKNYSLTNFFDLYIENNQRSDMEGTFLKRYYFLLIQFYFNQDTILKTFNKNTYDVASSSFKESDLGLLSISKDKIDEIMFNNTPNISGLEGQNNEVLILRREKEKSRRHMPLRTLFEKIPNLILTLKPILMMSPLSVSSFLESKEYTFDTVIFDEASQIKPESAIGAIYRSNQAIIVGDKEQLPPTNFFEILEDSQDDEYDEDYDNYQSILELANTIFRDISLKWHYRSKFEELIKVSNNEIYHNSLITFPHQNKPTQNEGIDFVYVEDGIFTRSSSKNKESSAATNLNEANKVVELIFNHFDKYGLTRSLGVVTFNKAQQDLIEKLIDRFRRNNNKYEEFFNPEIKEPFFIKNIETVQGDERDTIIISVAYGYDKDQKILMNFGPINKEGGYRRLNVATTRAKTNLILVSSIKDSDIDLSKTSSKGALYLKKYLSYAEKGIAFDEKEMQHEPLYLLDDVYSTLTKLGYKCVKNIGNSKCKIDLGIISPTDPNKYILGIEIDGTVNSFSSSIRDKERIKQEVLSSRGWNIYRLWSTEWFKNKEFEIARIQRKIDNILNKRETKKESIIENNVASTIPKEVKVAKFEIYPNLEELVNSYKDLPTKSALQAIITTTSPIHTDDLKKVIPPLYDRQVFSSVVNTYFQAEIKMLEDNKAIKIDGDFILAPGRLIRFRRYIDGNSTKRPLENIHHEEIKDGLLRIIKIVKSTNASDLVSLFIEDYCGYKKVSEKMTSFINDAVNDLIKQELIVLENNLISVKK